MVKGLAQYDRMVVEGHEAEVESIGVWFWSQCDCGWESRDYLRPQDALAAKRRHLRAALKKAGRGD